ncbi:hypothetical protein HN018_27760 (plasmid) [Lichenicola cladoniae]|uniref:Phytochrome central region domain-containing protein n=1 Tax=Lichenicola cladoniae TaxID=1484109 RepID=A0A6M8I0Q2_9PROT|nr:hypothetical protein [Acetobacteraceae bacterium]QKE93917.1 hypothetical protein HN018_27760 [Lichenicola cladoniae]
MFSTDSLSRAYPAGAGFQKPVSGVLSVTLSVDEPWLLLWFQAEQIETVEWAGNPHKAHSLDPRLLLTPRASFEAWAEIVRGRVRAWSLAEIEAATRLRSAWLDVQQNRRLRAQQQPDQDPAGQGSPAAAEGVPDRRGQSSCAKLQSAGLHLPGSAGQHIDQCRAAGSPGRTASAPDRRGFGAPPALPR